MILVIHYFRLPQYFPWNIFAWSALPAVWFVLKYSWIQTSGHLSPRVTVRYGGMSKCNRNLCYSSAWYFTLLTFVYVIISLALVLGNFCGRMRELYMSGKDSLACWRANFKEPNSWFKDFLLVDTHFIFAILFKFNTNSKKLFICCDYCFLFVCFSDSYGI